MAFLFSEHSKVLQNRGRGRHFIDSGEKCKGRVMKSSIPFFCDLSTAVLWVPSDNTKAVTAPGLAGPFRIISDGVFSGSPQKICL